MIHVNTWIIRSSLLGQIGRPMSWAQGVGRSNRPAPTNIDHADVGIPRLSEKSVVDDFVAVVSLEIYRLYANKRGIARNQTD